jgi:hypothetical protein
MKKFYEIREWKAGSKIIRWELWSMTEEWKWWAWPFAPRERWEFIGQFPEHRHALNALMQLTTGHYGERTLYTAGGEPVRGGWA